LFLFSITLKASIIFSANVQHFKDFEGRGNPASTLSHSLCLCEPSGGPTASPAPQHTVRDTETAAIAPRQHRVELREGGGWGGGAGQTARSFSNQVPKMLAEALRLPPPGPGNRRRALCAACAHTEGLSHCVHIFRLEDLCYTRHSMRAAAPSSHCWPHNIFLSCCRTLFCIRVSTACSSSWCVVGTGILALFTESDHLAWLTKKSPNGSLLFLILDRLLIECDDELCCSCVCSMICWVVFDFCRMK